MNNIKLVIDFCVRLLNTRISFPPYSFTFMQVFLATFILAIAFMFLRKLLS